MTVAFSIGYIAPAARLSNAWDTRVGGTLADALTCNAVVKSFGAEEREDDGSTASSRAGARACGGPGCALQLHLDGAARGAAVLPRGR